MAKIIFFYENLNDIVNLDDENDNDYENHHHYENHCNVITDDNNDDGEMHCDQAMVCQ